MKRDANDNGSKHVGHAESKLRNLFYFAARPHIYVFFDSARRNNRLGLREAGSGEMRQGATGR